MKRILSAIAALLLIAGCYVTQPEQNPQVTIPESQEAVFDFYLDPATAAQNEGLGFQLKAIVGGQVVVYTHGSDTSRVLDAQLLQVDTLIYLGRGTPCYDCQ